MTIYKLTEDDKKLLTGKELLDECWHERIMRDGYYLDRCHKCNVYFTELKNRTYLTPDDMFAVFRKLVDLRKWADFEFFALGRFIPDNSVKTLSIIEFIFSDIERFCWLVAQFLKGRVKG